MLASMLMLWRGRFIRKSFHSAKQVQGAIVLFDAQKSLLKSSITKIPLINDAARREAARGGNQEVSKSIHNCARVRELL